MKTLRQFAIWLGIKLLRFGGWKLPSPELLAVTRQMVRAADVQLAKHSGPYRHAKVYAALRIRFPREKESVLTQAIGMACR